MKHIVTKSVLEYWQSQRGMRVAPDRSDINPSDIRKFLGDTFIIQPEGDSFHFRLAGTRICTLFCRNLKNRDFVKLWEEKDRENLTSMLQSLQRSGACAQVESLATNNREKYLRLEMQLLPLTQGNRDGFPRILGTIVPLADPYWVGIHPIISQRIGHVNVDWPQEDTPAIHPFIKGRRSAPATAREQLQKLDIFKTDNTPPLHVPQRKVRHLTVYDMDLSRQD